LTFVMLTANSSELGAVIYISSKHVNPTAFANKKISESDAH